MFIGLELHHICKALFPQLLGYGITLLYHCMYQKPSTPICLFKCYKKNIKNLEKVFIIENIIHCQLQNSTSSKNVHLLKKLTEIILFVKKSNFNTLDGYQFLFKCSMLTKRTIYHVH